MSGALRFCMVATFYPPYHFGGDAIYVHRLANALAGRGHHVDVVHDVDAFYASGGRQPRDPFDEHENVHVHPLKSWAGLLSPLITHQTAQAWLKPKLHHLLGTNRYDVIHFHNPSLIGPSAFRLGGGVKLCTLHEHWLICPMHILWKFDRELCAQRDCVACTIRGGRPPQLWRYTGLLPRYLRHIDRFLSPSRFTRDKHLGQLDVPITVLPYFVPEPGNDSADRSPTSERPYFLFVGRLEKIKGLQTLIPVFRRYPSADLLVVGQGEYETDLRAMAADVPNVKFLGALHPARLHPLYRDALALIMPSIAYEVFGIVLIEAFAAKTPVIVRALGGMPEAVEDSGGGFVYQDDAELTQSLRSIQQSPELRRALGERGHAAYQRLWAETPHLAAYLDIVGELCDREKHASRVEA